MQMLCVAIELCVGRRSGRSRVTIESSALSDEMVIELFMHVLRAYNKCQKSYTSMIPSLRYASWFKSWCDISSRSISVG